MLYVCRKKVKLENGLREQDKELVFRNFDFNNRCKNKIEVYNEKICGRSSDTV